MPVQPTAGVLDYGLIYFGPSGGEEAETKPPPNKGAVYMSYGAGDRAWIANGVEWIPVPIAALLVIEAQIQTIYLHALQAGVPVLDDPAVLRSSMVQL